MITALVITVSDRASAGQYEDRSGPIVAQALTSWGIDVLGVSVVPDGNPVGEALRAAIGQTDVVITTGGTGLHPSDQTPEQTRPLLDRELPHLASAIAQFGVDNGVATAVLSRGLAGAAGSTLIVNLPGSTGGVRDGMAVLEPVLEHAVAQLRGGDHQVR